MAKRTKQTDKDFLLALACGATVEAAALRGRISERTAYRRLQDPIFRQRLQDKKREIVQRTMTMLNAVSLESSKTLAELQNSSQPPAVRLGAARATIHLAIKLRESSEFTERLMAVEELLQAGRAQ